MKCLLFTLLLPTPLFCYCCFFVLSCLFRYKAVHANYISPIIIIVVVISFSVFFGLRASKSLFISFSVYWSKLFLFNVSLKLCCYFSLNYRIITHDIAYFVCVCVSNKDVSFVTITWFFSRSFFEFSVTVFLTTQLLTTCYYQYCVWIWLLEVASHWKYLTYFEILERKNVEQNVRCPQKR